MPAPAWLIRRPIAHRGLHDPVHGIPENSLAAATAAIAADYAIEADIRPAADATPVVFHDRKLKRLTGRPGRTEDVAPQDLAQLRLAGTGEPVPTLDEFLAAVAGRTALLLEIKSDDVRAGGLALRFLSELADRLDRYRGPVAVMSFDPAAVACMARLAPDVPRGLVARAYCAPEDLKALGAWQAWRRRNLIALIETGASFAAYDATALPATAPALARLTGKRVLSWTVRSEHEQRRLRRHVDQIIFEGFRP
jgi:glycerophosphoryl diester phosphodiesterase